MRDVGAEVLAILARAAEVEPASLDVDLHEELGLDSFGLMQAVVWVEAELGVALDEAEIVTLRTPRALAELVESKLAHRARGIG